jgi:PilZ domain
MAASIQLECVLPMMGESGLDIPVQIRADGDSEIGARLLRVDRGFLQLSSTAAVQPASRIQLTLDGCAVRAEVIACEQQARSRFRLTVQRVYGPHGALRSEPRIPVDLSAIMTYPGCDRLFARIVDMSQSGLGFELSSGVPVGTKVSVRFACGIAFGDIRHCSETSGIYRAGMRIEEFVVRRPGPKEMDAVMRCRLAAHPVPRWTRYWASLLGQAKCSLVGHEYGWFTDQWDRPILRCSRCARVLSP